MKISIIQELLSKSDLWLASELRQSIENNEASIVETDTWIKCTELLDIYEMRLEHLKSNESSHAKQLYQTTQEFCDNLKKHKNEKAMFITFDTSEEHQYSLVVLKGSNIILACLKTVSQLDVTKERWNNLWEKNNNL